MRKLLFVLLPILSALSGITQPQESIRFEHLNYDELISRSKKEKKPVLIYFTGTGCFLCVKMEKNVFPKPEIAGFYNSNFINIESFDDGNKPDSATKRLRRKFGIVSNPTFIFTDSTGTIIHKSGYKETAGFLLSGQQAISNDNYKTWKDLIEAGKANAALMLKYLTAEQKPVLYAETNFVCEAQSTLDKYFNSIPKKDYLLPENWEIIKNYVANPFSQVFTYLLEKQADFTQLYSEKGVNEVIYKIIYDAWSGDAGSDGYKKAEAYTRSSTNSIAKLRVLQVDYLHQSDSKIQTLLRNSHEAKKYISIYDSHINQYPYLFNIYAVDGIANKIMDLLPDNTAYVTKAKKWMQLLLGIPGNEDYDFCATYARACFLTRDYKTAVQTQEKAIQLAIQSELDKKDIEEYKKQLTLYKNSAGLK
jgi:thioredoxin-related protein